MAKMVTISDIHQETNISKKVIWSEIQAGRLTASKVGKQYYVKQGDWNEYLRKRTFRAKGL